MSQLDSSKKLEEKLFNPIVPWITIFLLTMCIWEFVQSTSLGESWLKQCAFSGASLTYALQPGHISSLLTTLILSSYCQVNIWQLIGNLYFLWVFGSMVETRLGYFRYLILIALCQIIGWLILYVEVGPYNQTMYLGSGLLAASIIGAYMNFFPERKINLMGSVSRNYTTSRHQPTPNPAESFDISPGLLITIYLGYQIITQVVFNIISIHFDIISPIAAIGSFIIGLTLCWLMVVISTPNYKGNSLRRLVVQKYRELQNLDFSKEQSTLGAARLMNVTEDQAKRWIKQQNGLSGI